MLQYINHGVASSTMELCDRMLLLSLLYIVACLRVVTHSTL